MFLGIFLWPAVICFSPLKIWNSCYIQHQASPLKKKNGHSRPPSLSLSLLLHYYYNVRYGYNLYLYKKFFILCVTVQKAYKKGNKKTNKMAKQTHFSFHFQIGKLQVKKYSIINLIKWQPDFFYVLKTTINSRLPTVWF
jgi:hypothetical protein